MKNQIAGHWHVRDNQCAKSVATNRNYRYRERMHMRGCRYDKENQQRLSNTFAANSAKIKKDHTYEMTCIYPTNHLVFGDRFLD